MAFSPLPLGYCANVHPAATAEGVIRTVREITVPLRARLGRPMASGLWLPRSVATEFLRDAERVEELKRALAEADVSVHTANAFPFGDFHAERVKENVYLPDWTDPERIRYTLDIAELLAELLPEGVDGSVSTAPLGFKSNEPAGRSSADYVPGVMAAAKGLAELRSRTGRHIRLAIEPEPCCRLETTVETLRFFDELRAAVTDRHEAAAVARFIGVCYDVCHQAVEFEDVADSIRTLDRADIPLVKIHITSALTLPDPADPVARAELAAFVEPRYLHQTFARLRRPTSRLRDRENDATRGLLDPDAPRANLPADSYAVNGAAPLRVTDLTRELCDRPEGEWMEADEWRIHFHVPIHAERLGRLGTTREDLIAALAAVGGLEQTPHLEVETYTWGVLSRMNPAGSPDLVGNLAEELTFANRLIETLGEAQRA
jgi:sugar phosphate isomerase/epimerase